MHPGPNRDLDVDRLAATLDGAVLTDAHPDFAERCTGWNTLRSHHPQVIVVAATATDVAVAVRFAAAEGLRVGVQSTGHGMALAVDDLLVDTSELCDLHIDPERRTARIGAGCTWGTVLAAAQQVGLAPLLGSSPSVGAVGYTLGGGIGWLARRHGAACDSVLSFEVVTADGQQRKVSQDEDADLFRALRGGGGAFGVVTAMEISLVELRTVYAGNLYYPTALAGEIAERYAAWVTTVPDELTSSLVFVNLPPSPELPEAMRGRSFVAVRGCWCGALDAGRALLDEWRAETPPLLDQWDTMAFSEVATISNDRVEPTPAVVAGEWLQRLDRSVGETLATGTFAEDGPPLLRFSELRHLGGAIARQDRRVSSFGHRSFPFFANMVGTTMYHDESQIASHERDLLARLGDASTGAAYLNYLDHDARRLRTPDAFGAEDRNRLAELQRRVDPNGMFSYGADHR